MKENRYTNLDNSVDYLFRVLITRVALDCIQKYGTFYLSVLSFFRLLFLMCVYNTLKTSQSIMY